MTDTKYSSVDGITVLDFSEHVRKRPFMYVGNDGIIGLLSGLIIECISLCKTDDILFEITILGDNDFTFVFSSSHELKSFTRQFTTKSNELPNYFAKTLKAISEKFDIIENGNSKTQVTFSFDKKVISETSVDNLRLSEKAIQIALLNRQCEIITIDKRQKYLIQNFYHFPQGVFICLTEQ
ncbi:hypothetical protein [Ferruginibacter sp.]